MVAIKAVVIVLVFGIGFVLAPVIRDIKLPKAKFSFKSILFYLEQKIGSLFSKRKKKFKDQLAEALESLSSLLESGASIFQAIKAVSDKMSQPVSDEFKIVLQELKIGIPFEQALANLEKRVKCDELTVVVTAIEISLTTGASLSEILKKVSKTLREKHKIKEKVDVLTAQGRAQALIISLLPVFLVLLILMIDPQFIMPMFNTGIGFLMIAVAIVMEVVGIILIGRIVRIEI